MSATFRKQERMVSRKLMEMLFGGGSSHSMAAFPLRAVYAVADRGEGDAPVQLLVSVSKRRFKHAVDRNRVKRQIREAYRLHKALLIPSVPEGQQLLVALVWLSDRHVPTADVERRVVGLLHRIAEKLSPVS
jgi:ribonuclease P protein component